MKIMWFIQNNPHNIHPDFFDLVSRESSVCMVWSASEGLKIVVTEPLSKQKAPVALHK